MAADSNRWQNLTIQAVHGFAVQAGSNGVLDNVVMQAVNLSGHSPAGSVPRILTNGVSFDLHGIDVLSFAFIEGFNHDGPAEVLIGQKSGPIESYAVKRAESFGGQIW